MRIRSQQDFDRFLASELTEAQVYYRKTSIKITLERQTNGRHIHIGKFHCWYGILRPTTELWNDIKKRIKNGEVTGKVEKDTKKEKGRNVEKKSSKVSKVKKKEGLRFNEGKTRLELIPPEFIESVGAVLTFGATKYAAENWRNFNEEQLKQCIGSAMRHIEAYRKGEWNDKESNLPHLAHAAVNMAFILTLRKEK